jgi:cyanophycinase-like exopeptidase
MKKILLFLLFPSLLFSQGYTSYFTGNTNNITTVTTPGTCLMGGATENDNAMKWLLEKANGGDIVVIRSTGTNGYNNYFYTDLGITVNSVETLVITSAAGAVNPYVLNKVINAEMIWFAGGDQANYVNYFKNNALENAINNHINVKQAPIGGTSAGMAILGGKYFSALNGSITSAQALANPYNAAVTLGINDFLNVPFLQEVTTDTHFDNPDRKGRLMAFLARNATDQNNRSFGIASNEYVAVCIDENGKASVYGDYPNYPEFAYFLQANCQSSFLPETCLANTSLTWNRNGEAVKVYKVPGTMNGANYFQIDNWQTGSGGSWENWKVINGVFSSNLGTPSTCVLKVNEFSNNEFQIYPIPFKNEIFIEKFEGNIKIIDLNGKIILEKHLSKQGNINTRNLQSGVYAISLESNGKVIVRKIIKE